MDVVGRHATRSSARLWKLTAVGAALLYAVGGPGALALGWIARARGPVAAFALAHAAVTSTGFSASAVGSARAVAWEKMRAWKFRSAPKQYSILTNGTSSLSCDVGHFFDSSELNCSRRDNQLVFFSASFQNFGCELPGRAVVFYTPRPLVACADRHFFRE